MAGEPFCRSCGAILPAGALKCADCGAPVGAVVRGARPAGFSRALWAGFILMALFGLAIFQGVLVLVEKDLPSQEHISFTTQTFAVSGRVVDGNGTPVAGANVSLAPQGNQTRTTGADGSFRFERADAGYLEIRVAAPPHGNATLRLFLLENENVNITVPSAGAVPSVVDDPSYHLVASVTRALGVVWILLGLIVLGGAIAAYRRRGWGLALTGSIVGLLVSLPLGLFLGTIAIVLVATGKKEFEARP